MHHISDVCSGGSFILCERSRRHVVLLFAVVTAGYGRFMIMLSAWVFMGVHEAAVTVWACRGGKGV